MKCTTSYYINSAISKSVSDLLEQHIPKLVESCKTAQYLCVYVLKKILSVVSNHRGVFLSRK